MNTPYYSKVQFEADWENLNDKKIVQIHTKTGKVTAPFQFWKEVVNPSLRSYNKEEMEIELHKWNLKQQYGQLVGQALIDL